MEADRHQNQPGAGSQPPAGLVSVCIVARNEADKLEPCHQSITWAAEILRIEMESTDGTAALAAAYGARIIRRAPYPIVEPLRNELAALAHGEWILALDPDERVTPGLARALQQAARRPEIDAVMIPFTNYDLGYPPTPAIHRYESHLRMYRRTAVSWPSIPNTQPVVAAERKYVIPSDDQLVMIHDRNRNLPEVVDRVMRYAPLQGQSMQAEGQVFTARALLGAMAQVVDKQFLVGRPWEDGVPGLFRAGILTAFKFYVWVGFWQAAGGKRTEADDRVVRRWGSVFYGLARLVRLGLRVYARLERAGAA